MNEINSVKSIYFNVVKLNEIKLNRFKLNRKQS